jgi:hypothetical protein
MSNKTMKTWFVNIAVDGPPAINESRTIFRQFYERRATRAGYMVQAKTAEQAEAQVLKWLGRCETKILNTRLAEDDEFTALRGY